MRKGAKIAGIVIVVVAVVFCVGSYALDRYFLSQTYARMERAGLSLLLTDDDIAAEHPYTDVQFDLNGNTVRGHVYGAENTRGLIVFRHGIFSHHQDYLALITALVDKGWKVFAYDAIGCGESDGDSVIGFAQSPLDVRAAVQYACNSGMADGMPLLLFGHSWGGYGVAAALDFPEVRDRVTACVAMSGFDTPNEIINESSEGRMGPVAATQKPFIDLIGRMDFGNDANRSASKAVSECGIPVMIVQGTGDAVVTAEGSSIYADRADIKNPQVVYVVKSDSGRDGHNTFFYSPESQAYLAECTDRLERLQAEYGETLPLDVQAEFLASVDKHRANTADPELIDQIDGFFQEAITARK